MNSNYYLLVLLRTRAPVGHSDSVKNASLPSERSLISCSKQWHLPEEEFGDFCSWGCLKRLLCSQCYQTLSLTLQHCGCFSCTAIVASFAQMRSCCLRLARIDSTDKSMLGLPKLDLLSAGCCLRLLVFTLRRLVVGLNLNGLHFARNSIA
jgi:hypothetical protein